MEAVRHQVNGKANVLSMKRLQGALTLGVLSLSVLFPFASAGAQSSDLPEGPGKAAAVENCTACHGVELLTAQRRSSAEWEEVVNRMMANGAFMTEDQYNEVISYLGKYLGTASASNAGEASPAIASNTATPAASGSKPKAR